MNNFFTKFERTKSPLTKLNIGLTELANKIVEETKDSFTYNRYGPNWKEIILWLLKKSYTKDAIEFILRSKLMRYASDAEGATLEGFLRFNNELFKNKTQIDYFLETEFKSETNETMSSNLFITLFEDMGGVSTPASTTVNTPGMGNAQPAQIAAMTGSQQQSPLAKGSGDKWGNMIGKKPYTQGKKKKKKKLEEENINPHDKLGVAMAKKMKVPVNFKKHKKDQGVSQKRVGESHIMTLDEFQKLMESREM